MNWRNLLMVVGLTLSCGQAYSALNVCNETDSALTLAGIQRKAIFLEDAWTSGGWFEIKPGDCLELDPYTNQEFKGYLSIYDVEKEKLYFPKKFSQKNRMKSVEKFFCVSKQSFDRRRIPLKKHEECPRDWHLQLFNIYIYVPTRMIFTLTLN